MISSIERGSKSRRMVVVLLSALALNVVGLLATTLLLLARTTEVEGQARAITRNAVPSLRRISSIRTTLRHLEVTLDDYMDASVLTTERVHEPNGVEEDRARLREDWKQYVALPTFLVEGDLRSTMGADLAELDGLVARLLSQVDTGDRAFAKRLFDGEGKASFDQLDGRLFAANSLNANGAERAASAIDGVQRDIRVLSMMVNGLCAFAGALATLVAVRMMRDYMSVTENQIQELELFSGRLAHDIRGPLSSASLAVTVAEKSASDATARELLGRADRTLKRIAQLVDGLLLVARASRTPDPGARADVSVVINDVVEECRSLADKECVELCVEDVPRFIVAASPGVLANMLGNLIGNAIKYMGDSKVRVVTVGADDRGRRVRFRVSDTGPGIPRAAQSAVFETFVRAAPSGVVGLGLGLATVKRLAEMLGGDAGLDPTPEVGSLLWFEVPKAPER